jgi:hypothetical protein
MSTRKRDDLHDVGQRGTRRGEDARQVFNHAARLRADVELHRTHRVCGRADNRVVGLARAQSRDKMKSPARRKCG